MGSHGSTLPPVSPHHLRHIALIITIHRVQHLPLTELYRLLQLLLRHGVGAPCRLPGRQHRPVAGRLHGQLDTVRPDVEEDPAGGLLHPAQRRPESAGGRLARRRQELHALRHRLRVAGQWGSSRWPCCQGKEGREKLVELHRSIRPFPSVGRGHRLRLELGYD